MGNDFLRIYRPVLSSVMSIAIRQVSFGYKSRPDTPMGTPDHIPSSSLELPSSSSSSSSTTGLGFAESWDSVDARNVTKTKLITLQLELLSSVCIDSLAKFCILWFWPIKGFDTFRQCLLSHCWDLEVENGKNEPGERKEGQWQKCVPADQHDHTLDFPFLLRDPCKIIEVYPICLGLMRNTQKGQNSG